MIIFSIFSLPQLAASARTHDTRMSREIVYHSDHPQARFLDEFCDRRRLPRANFDDQLATARKMLRRSCHYLAQDIEAVRSCAQSDQRFMLAHFGFQSGYLCITEIRRVRDNYIEGSEARSSAHNVEAISATVRYVLMNVVPQEIPDAKRARMQRNVGCGHPRARGVYRDRNRNRPGAGADVEHARIGLGFDIFQRRADNELRLRPRNEHFGADIEVERKEFLVPDYVRNRLALLATRDHRVEFVQYRF